MTLQRIDPRADREAPLDEGRDERPQFAGPWLTTHEAAAYLRYEGKSRLLSLYRFLRVNGVPKVYKSPRRLLIAKADIDRALKVRKRA